MALKISDVLTQTQIDYWVHLSKVSNERSGRSRRSHNLMLFIADRLSTVPILERSHDQLLVMTHSWLADYLSRPYTTKTDHYIESHLLEIEAAVFGLCARRDQLVVNVESGWQPYFR